MNEPNNGRATVALVYEAVNGLRELTRAEFTAVQRQLDALANVPERLSIVEERQQALQKRVEAVERDRDEDQEYDRVQRPSLFISFASLVVAIVAVLVMVLL